jgi:uncharacterized protein (DUF849 family)
MAHSNKVIITCAVTGSIHMPSISPHLPLTREQIADGRRGGSGRGHHSFARARSKNRSAGPDDGRICAVSPAGEAAVVNIASGGSPYVRVDERAKPARADEVRIVRKILEGLGREIATPEMLQLKGGHAVGF